VIESIILKKLAVVNKLRKNHSDFDVIWNEGGRETQEFMVKNAPQLLSSLSEWYIKNGKLIEELEQLNKEEA